MTDTPEDIEREQFLMRLTRSGVQLDESEQNVVDAVLMCAQATYFTPEIREKIDELKKRHPL